jgi:predicted DNA-binding protein
MGTITIRVSLETHQRLRHLAEKRGRTIGEVVDEAARKLEDADFWDEVNAAYERLRADPIASAEYDAEVAALDTISLVDFDEPPYEGIDELIAATEQAEAARVRLEPRLPEYEGIEELMAKTKDPAMAKA